MTAGGENGVPHRLGVEAIEGLLTEPRVAEVSRHGVSQRIERVTYAGAEHTLFETHYPEHRARWLHRCYVSK